MSVEGGVTWRAPDADSIMERRAIRPGLQRVAVFDAVQQFVVRIVRSWERDDPRRAVVNLIRNYRGFDGLVTWMNEQQRRIKDMQRRHKERQAMFLAKMRELEKDRSTGRKKDAVTLQDDDVKVAIITTASLPWMTGTAVNPLLRAAYLARLHKKVTLLVPWLSPADQEQIHPGGRVFESPEEQETFVRNWLRNRVGFDTEFKLTFYPGKYIAEKGSIFAVGDITQYVPDSEAQIAILEEPEHLNWYHVGRRWCDKFKHVVGVVHTNYLEYVRREENGQLKENVLRVLNDWVVRAAGVHTVVKLSDAVQEFKRAETCFVHGVSPKFLEIGKMVAQRWEAIVDGGIQGLEPSAALQDSVFNGDEEGVTAVDTFDGFDKGCYFLGKVLWGKGYSELLALMQKHSQTNGSVSVDVFGSGPDLNAVESEANRRKLDLHFLGAKDHGDTDFRRYKVFINPSMSDVVATTTAEALAMGKFVICADHPSNAFFREFRNCLTYRTPAEFSSCLSRALAEEPAPLRPDELRSLSWEAATERFLRVAEPHPEANPRELPKIIDSMTASAVWYAHQSLQHLEPWRLVIGAAPGTRNSLGDLSEVNRLDDLPSKQRAMRSLGRQKYNWDLAHVMGLKPSKYPDTHAEYLMRFGVF